MAALNFKRELRGIENLLHISNPKRKTLINLGLLSFTFKSDPMTKRLPAATGPPCRDTGVGVQPEGSCPLARDARIELGLLKQAHDIECQAVPW